MSTALYERTLNRESTIWSRFKYQDIYSVEVNSNRDDIFNLFNEYYRNGVGYLTDLETEQRTWILNEYTVSAAKLDADELALETKIAAQKYIEELKTKNFEDKLLTMQHERDHSTRLLDAQIASVESDRDALITMKNRINIAKDEAETKILLIEAKIQLESLHQSEVDIEIAQKELQAIRQSHRIMEIDLEILNIEQKILEVALEIVQNSVRIAQVGADIAKLGSEIARVGLWGLDWEIIKTIGDTLDLQHANEPDAKKRLLAEKINMIKEKAETLVARLASQTALNDFELDDVATRESVQIEEMVTKLGLDQDKTKAIIATLKTHKTMAEKIASVTKVLENEEKQHDEVIKFQSGLDYEAFVAIANFKREANLENTLTHEIT